MNSTRNTIGTSSAGSPLVRKVAGALAALLVVASLTAAAAQPASAESKASCRRDTYGTFTSFVTYANCIPPGMKGTFYGGQTASGYRVRMSGDGCSYVPDRPLTFDFRNACGVHDYMYALLRYFGQGDEGRYGNLRERADQIFRSEMYSLCRLYPSAAGSLCRRQADIYYQGVRKFGDHAADGNVPQVRGAVRL